MADSFAVGQLYDDVVARFTTEQTPAEFYFGWREPERQRPANRVVIFSPGDPGGSFGPILPVRRPGEKPGTRPRSLATIDELVTIYCDAYDPTNAENERVQYDACRLLFDDVMRAVYLAAVGRFAIRSNRWLQDKVQRRKGATIEIVLAVQGFVPDVASASLTSSSAPYPLAALAEVSELDASVTIATQEIPT